MTKEQSSIIKGIAIILMLFYHLGCIEGIQGLNNIVLHTISTAAHPIDYFLIISGYGLYHAYKQNRITWSYLFKRTLRLYIAYWLVLLFFVFGIASIFYPERFSFTCDKTLMNLIGWHWDYCNFTWFFLPYIFMSFSAKWIFRLTDWMGTHWSIICGLITFLFTSFLISRFYNSWLHFHFIVYHIVLWAQTLFSLIIGATMAKLKLTGHKITWEKLYGHNIVILLLLMLLFTIRGQIHSFALNPFHASFVIWLVLHLNVMNNVAIIILVELGKKSFLMWLTQGFIAVVMFSEYFVRLQWPLLILIVWTAVCYIISCLLLPLSNRLAQIVLYHFHH